MTTLTKQQQRDLAKLGYPNVVSVICSDDEPAEACGVGSHSDVWKVASPEGVEAVAKFWSPSHLDKKAPQERALRKAASKYVSCMPRVLGSTKQCTLMTLCQGVTVDYFARQVASDPTRYTVEGIERVLVGFVEAVSEITVAGIYNDDMHDHNVLVDYPRRVVWVIDPYISDRGHVDTGATVVKIFSRCITIVAAAHARATSADGDPRMCGDLRRALVTPHEYVSWNSVA